MYDFWTHFSPHSRLQDEATLRRVINWKEHPHPLSSGSSEYRYAGTLNILFAIQEKARCLNLFLWGGACDSFLSPLLFVLPRSFHSGTSSSTAKIPSPNWIYSLSVGNQARLSHKLRQLLKIYYNHMVWRFFFFPSFFPSNQKPTWGKEKYINSSQTNSAPKPTTAHIFLLPNIRMMALSRPPGRQEWPEIKIVSNQSCFTIRILTDKPLLQGKVADSSVLSQHSMA